jgi:catechol 2,3-dioxygenase-like lactoylglutathione lyase family enzyme
MKPGAFSISLSVKDINISRKFYEGLGFKMFAGNIEKNYLIMKNGTSLIGLFQGMFENNILTFNPGWDQDAKAVPDFDDIRSIQKHLKEQGFTPESEVDDKGSGPGSFIVLDPDGNAILFDQHV